MGLAIKGAVSAKGSATPEKGGVTLDDAIGGEVWKCLPLELPWTGTREELPAPSKSSDAALDGTRESLDRSQDDLVPPFELPISSPRSTCLVSLQAYRQNPCLAGDFHRGPAANKTG